MSSNLTPSGEPPDPERPGDSPGDSPAPEQPTEDERAAAADEQGGPGQGQAQTGAEPPVDRTPPGPDDTQQLGEPGPGDDTQQLDDAQRLDDTQQLGEPGPGDDTQQLDDAQRLDDTQRFGETEQPGEAGGTGPLPAAWSGRAQVRPPQPGEDASSTQEWYEPIEPPRSWWPPVLVGILALLLLGVLATGIYLIAQALADNELVPASPSPSPSATSSPTPSPTPVLTTPPPEPSPDSPETSPPPPPPPPSPPPPPPPSPTTSPEPPTGPPTESPTGPPDDDD